MVEAIEDLFIPVLVYNNKREDEVVLKSFEEPAWNNPVIRFLKSDGGDIIPRQDGVWETPAVAKRVCDALQTAGQGVPLWLKSLDSPPVDSTMMATFAMHCYWVGEARLGGLNGVLATRSAWIGDKEVVHLVYDTREIDYKTLIESALKMECASTVFTHNDEQYRTALSIVGEMAVEPITDIGQIRDAKSADQKYSLAGSIMRFLPLTEIQAVKVNACLANDLETELSKWISLRQRELLTRIRSTLDRDPESLDSLVRPVNGAGLTQYSDALVLVLEKQESR